MKIISFFLLFFLYSSFCYCQLPVMPADVKQYITAPCTVCSGNLQNASKILYSAKYSDTALHYHKCHVFFAGGAIDSAYKYSLYTLSELRNERESERSIAITLIKAKILYNKSFLKPSLHEYLSLLATGNLSNNLAGYICTNIGSIYVELEDYKAASLYLLRAVDEYGIDDKKNLKIAYNNLGICYLNNRRMDSAELYFKKSISTAEGLKDTLGLAYLYTNIANQYYEQYQDKPAIAYFSKALAYAGLTKDILIKQIAYQNMAVVCENKKDYKSALAYRKLYEEQHDSIYNRDKVWGTAQEKNKLDSELSSKALLLSQQKNQLQSLTLDKQKQQLYIAVFASVAFLCFFGFAFYAYQQKNKQNQIITAQREELDALNHTKDQLFSVVAHDLRSPVQTLRVSLHKLKTALHHNNTSEAEQVAGDVEGIANGTYSLLNNLLYWALSQTGQLHFTREKLNLCRLTEQVLYDYNSVAAAKNIALENRVPESLHCTGDLNTVKIILRNVTDNAIKFSEPYTSVVISGNEKENECIVSITNSGKPIDEAVVQALNNKNTKRLNSHQKQSTGIGFWLVKTMAERNGGSLQIEKQTNGTRINIHLPQYQNHEQTADTYS